MTPKILSSCHPVGQPDSINISYLVTLPYALTLYHDGPDITSHVVLNNIDHGSMNDPPSHDVKSIDDVLALRVGQAFGPAGLGVPLPDRGRGGAGDAPAGSLIGQPGDRAGVRVAH